jgi:hypothetical protein
MLPNFFDESLITHTVYSYSPYHQDFSLAAPSFPLSFVAWLRPPQTRPQRSHKDWRGMCNAVMSVLLGHQIQILASNSIPFSPPYVRSSRSLTRQTTNNIDTTHHNTTSQRRKSLVGFVRWILDVSAPASGVLTALLSFDYLQRISSPDRADDRINGRESKHPA